MTGERILPGLELQAENVAFVPTREAGLSRLDRFVSRTGSHYARQRNYDFGPERRTNISALSPWIRRRLVTEDEVLAATLARHGPNAAEKFVQEVFWRTYFKGWMEQRPSVWATYQTERDRAFRAMQVNRAVAVDYDDAISGRTGIECFDAWARELQDTGYLHNHVRMWFASIWIFTLRLPWELGADFFLRHLLDGDPASNTLGWRWVAGLHTKGKAYQARASNIAKYTEGRFHPVSDLATDIEPLNEEVVHPIKPLQKHDDFPSDGFLLLVTDEDCSIETVLPRSPVAVLGVSAAEEISPHGADGRVANFAKGAVTDALERLLPGAGPQMASSDWVSEVRNATDSLQVKSIVTAYAPVGPMAAQLSSASEELKNSGITIHQIQRTYDRLAWPYAAKGFFWLKKKIPSILSRLGMHA